MENLHQLPPDIARVDIDLRKYDRIQRGFRLYPLWGSHTSNDGLLYLMGSGFYPNPKLHNLNGLSWKCDDYDVEEYPVPAQSDQYIHDHFL